MLDQFFVSRNTLSQNFEIIQRGINPFHGGVDGDFIFKLHGDTFLTAVKFDDGKRFRLLGRKSPFLT